MKMKSVETQDELREASAEHDLDVKFDGRTLVITCVFHTIVDPRMLSDRMQESAAGPHLCMTVGTVARRRDGYFLKTFVNTDESVEDVAARCGTMDPRPTRTEVGVVSPTQARELWASLHHAIDGGD